MEVKPEIIEEKLELKPQEHKIFKGKALAARLREAREEGILITKRAREELVLKAEVENAKAFKELCSLFDKSLEFSTRVATSLEEKQNGASASGVPDEELDQSLFTGGTLRGYQVEGATWMVKLRKQGLNGILADEMGLGKTAQSIAMICHLVSTGSTGPFLILGPLSTVRNWENEFHRFSPSIPVFVLHGNNDERKKILRKIGVKHKLGNGSGKSIFPVVVAPYHCFVADIKRLVRFKWAYFVVDEASVIKNHDTAINRSVSSLYVTGKLLLTGTPLQNNIKELFNLLHFCLPNIFADYRLFEGWLEELEAHREEGSFGDGDSCQLVSTMHSILAPFFLRRTKSTVQIDLPPKKHIVVFCPMTTLQQTYYKAILSAKQDEIVRSEVQIYEDGQRPMRNCRRNSIYGKVSEKKRRASELEESTPAKRKRWLSSVDSDASQFSEASNSNASSSPTPSEPELSCDAAEEMRLLKAGLMKFSSASMNYVLAALRRAVAHPWLVHFDKSWGSYYPKDRKELLEKSGKMQVFDILLRQLLKKKHKVLVFSGFTQVLDIVGLYLDLSNVEYLYLHGNIKLDERQHDIDAFNDPNSEARVFLISTRAGGMGINLTGADTVIFFDTDWNPQIDLQAADRCHRIGQTQRVVIYRLIAKGTVDERILDVSTNKRRLEKLVMKCGNFEKVSSTKDIQGGDLLQVLSGVDWDSALDLDLLDPSRIEALADRDLVFKNEEDAIDG